MDPHGAGRVLITVGAVIILIGVLLAGGQHLRLGHLPGDIVFHRGGVKVYLPITTMVVVSVALTLLINLVHEIVHR